MAGFAVVVRRSGRPVPPAVVDALRTSLAHRGPDGVEATVLGSIAVVHARLHSTAPAWNDQQPYAMPGGGWMVADARLDERAPLMRRLGWSRPAADTADVALLAESYRRFGETMGEQLLGDFAIVAIEPDGRITCIRDHLGIKPLYYWHGDEWIVVSSELRQIAAHPQAPRDLDLQLLGEYLSGHVESTSGTVRRDVRRLPAAHTLTVHGGRRSVRRYWTPPFDDRLELSGPEEYAERFLDLLTEAVRCRLPASGPVATELSGGLDSSSVTGIAAQLVESSGGPADKVLALSCLFPWSRRAEERRYIDRAVETFGVDWLPIDDPVDRTPWAYDDAAFWSDIPLPPDGPDHVRLCREARARGCAVVLTGHGGDHAFDPAPFVLAELLEDRRLLQAWRTTSGRPRSRAATLLRNSRWALLRPHPPGRRAPSVIGAARTEARLDARPDAGRLPSRYRRRRAQGHYEQFAGGYDAMSLEVIDRTAARAGVEFRHPYLDRRLVEFG